MIHNQTVTPPLAAIEGTTFKLNTATTKRSNRSRRPRARIRYGCSGCTLLDKVPQELPGVARRTAEGGCPHIRKLVVQGGRGARPYTSPSVLLPPERGRCAPAALSPAKLQCR